ncbi:hypothetical protein ACP8HI_04810 [Paenibacillus sp. FA6]|uniref:hypothetical protein n=1 Tax=Paenibacillus sp. FA6 TaxID=3413029 RepID=UPI003F65FE97
MGKLNTDFFKYMNLAIAAVFLIEIIGGIFILVGLNNYYSRVMNGSFLITLPLSGILGCFRTKRVSPAKLKIVYGLQIFILLLAPTMLWAFFPNYSYEEAKMLIHEQKQNTTDYKIEETEERTFGLVNSGNIFIKHGYLFKLNENETQVEYIVNPVSGKVYKLSSE